MDGLPPVKSIRQSLRATADFLLGEYIKGGGPVHELTAEQRAAWKAKFEPNREKF